MEQLKCPMCFSQDIAKKGWLRNKKNPNPIRQYRCRPCGRRFSYNALKDTKLQKKPQLNDKIMKLYCERGTLRGIARVLKVNYKTVVRKFLFMAVKAREIHLKTLDEKGIVTKYIQFDEMETFEHTREKPLGIALSVRPKTGEIVSAKVSRIPIKALTLSPKKKRAYKDKTNKREKLAEMLLETSKALHDGYSVLSCDGSPEYVKMSKIMCPKSLVETHINDYAGMWRLNHTCAKLRHHISRLNRKTWATTKREDRLQMHIDLFIAYQNGYSL